MTDPRFLLALPLILTACATAPPRAGTAGLAPPPPGWFAFCAAHGGDCDPIPPASAMPDARPAMAPPAWHDFCRRHRSDAACSG